MSRAINTNSTESQVRRIDAATKIWAAGVQASRLSGILAESSGVELVGRVKVEVDCTLPGHPDVFVIGDLMSLDNLAGVAQVAIQSGRHAAQTIVRRVAGDDRRRRFRYSDSGKIAIISPPRGRCGRTVARLRLACMGALAPCPPRDAGWLQEPRVRYVHLDDCTSGATTRTAGHHAAAGARRTRG
jgi:NADH dehydrogenase FAD-containing subunit